MHVILNATQLEELPVPATFRVTMMIQAAGFAFDVSAREILGIGRTARVARARHVAMWLIRTNTNLSLVEIGTTFGRDHGTVIHACRNVAEWIRQGGEIAVTIECLNRQFSNKQNNAKPEHSNAHGQFDP